MKGQIMLLAVMLVGGSILGVTSIAGYLMLQRIRISSDIAATTKAIYAADAGIEWELYKSNSTFCPPVQCQDKWYCPADPAKKNNVYDTRRQCDNDTACGTVFLCKRKQICDSQPPLCQNAPKFSNEAETFTSKDDISIKSRGDFKGVSRAFELMLGEE